MGNAKRLTASLVLALVLVAGIGIAHAYDDGYYDSRARHEDRYRNRGYNDEYIFATTKMVSDWDMDPAFKVPLFPPAVVIDLVFLPAEMIAGFF